MFRESRDNGDARIEAVDTSSECKKSTDRSGTELKEFFIIGTGIHREVLQTEICKYLGPEATSRPSTFRVRNPICSGDSPY